MLVRYSVECNRQQSYDGATNKPGKSIGQYIHVLCLPSLDV